MEQERKSETNLESSYQSKQAENETVDAGQDQSKCDIVCPNISENETIHLLQDASSYVESVMASQKMTAVLRTPLLNRRKRT